MPATARTPHLQSVFDPAFGRDVAEGLARSSRKRLPPAWFYDDAGSALFDSITRLPEYGLTRAEGQLLAASSGEIVGEAGSPRLILELGSGSGFKTRHLLRAAVGQASDQGVTYLPIDVSPAALKACSDSLVNVPGLHVVPLATTYLEGVSSALQHRARPGSAMVLFLGSTIGNFSRPEARLFLERLRLLLRPADTLLVGTDLVKPRETLLAAYDDSAGVTAAFNLNLLVRINRELGGEFDLSRFAHEARWNVRARRVEMHLRSKVSQKVRIGRLGLIVSFAAGETIWTESSHKFRRDEMSLIAAGAGWGLVRQWTEPEWGFAETLVRVA